MYLYLLCNDTLFVFSLYDDAKNLPTLLGTKKQKYIHGNEMPFFNKELSSPHKKRTELRNRYLNKRSYQNKKLYTKQQNFCVSFLRKTKKNTMPI